MSILLLIKKIKNKNISLKINNKIKIKYLKSLKENKVFTLEGIIKKIKKGGSIIILSVKFGNLNLYTSLNLSSPLILDIIVFKI